jgi:putative CocE/NonD family hydrolase
MSARPDPFRRALRLGVGASVLLGVAALQACGPARPSTPAATPAAIPAVAGTADLPIGTGDTDYIHTREVAVPMRDGVVLRAEVLLPRAAGPFPTLVYRTPYGRLDGIGYDSIFVKAVRRGYAVVVQDVRGRYASAGEFRPYEQEGRDGYDTIEWAAAQPWSNGSVGTFGLSYPGAVQWLAAVESPPHLKAMVPAMTYATPHRFFYAGGVWDNSWVAWVWQNIAPDLRRRLGVPGPQTDEEAARSWESERDRALGQLPLAGLPDFEGIAPWYYDWLRHPPDDPWWSWADLTGKYGRTTAAVLSISGWHDEAYGPQGAVANFTGLVESRAGIDARARLVIGPWPHGTGGMRRTRVGAREVGEASRIDYDELVLRWMDRWVRGIDNGVEREPAVRVFVMGSNRWRAADRWPLPGTRPDTLWLSDAGDGVGVLGDAPPADTASASSFVSDPANPVVDPFYERGGARDYRDLGARPDVLTFETAPLPHDVDVVGPMRAEIWISTDAPDTDLWVKVLDVAPDGTAYNLMYPGGEVLRASYRDGRRSLLEPRRHYLLRVPEMFTGNSFRAGHRIRIHIMTSFFPHFSRNLHTGELETTTARMRTARITVHHGGAYASRLILPVVPTDTEAVSR